MKLRLLAILLLLAACSGAKGQLLTRLTNINQSVIGNGNSFPRSFCIFDGKLYFIANSSSRAEPWYTDGTLAGTRLLKSVEISNGFFVAGSKLFFTAYDAINGTGIWVSDGTSAGTHIVKNMASGSIIALADKIIFSGSDSLHGQELWISDGTNTGTHLLKDINPSHSSNPGAFLRAGNKVFFLADDGVHYYNFWITDGTDTGTHLVKEVSHSSTTAPTEICVYQNSILFKGSTLPPGYYDFEPWISDGTDTGTHVLHEINHHGSSYPWHFVVYANKAFFGAFDTGISGSTFYPFITDGTDTGTHKINYPILAQPVFMNGKWYGTVSDASGTELWTSDGTSAGTHIVRDIYPGAGSSSPAGLTALNNRLYFSAVADSFGRQLWSTDGTDTGTRQTISGTWDHPSPLGFGGNITNQMAAFTDALYFPARFDTACIELWRLDPNIPTGIPHYEAAGQITIYPNPASDLIHIAGITVREAFIYNAAGQQVGSSTGNTIHTGTLPPGIYSVKIRDKDGRSYHGRFIRLL